MKNPEVSSLYIAVLSTSQRMQMETPPFPLSSRAQPRDLQFYGPFLEMFSTELYQFRVILMRLHVADRTQAVVAALQRGLAHL